VSPYGISDHNRFYGEDLLVRLPKTQACWRLSCDFRVSIQQIHNCHTKLKVVSNWNPRPTHECHAGST